MLDFKQIKTVIHTVYLLIYKLQFQTLTNHLSPTSKSNASLSSELVSN